MALQEAFMVKQDERDILSLRSTLLSIPEYAPVIPMKDIMNLLSVRVDLKESVKVIEKGEASLRIKKMEFDPKNQIVFLLIHYFDKRISNPVFGDFEKGTLRSESKLEGEGIAVSAHLAFSMIPAEDRISIYETVLEVIPGVGRSKLMPFLTSEFNEISNFTFKHEGAICDRRPKIEINGQPSTGLKEDLKAGRFRGISLVRHKVESRMDEDEVLKPEKETTSLKIRKGIKPSDINPIELVKRIFKKAKKDGYDDVLVHYVRDNKKTKTVPIKTNQEDAMDVLFIKNQTLKLKKPVEQCIEKFNNDIKKYMTDLIIKSREKEKKSQKEQQPVLEETLN